MLDCFDTRYENYENLYTFHINTSAELIITFLQGNCDVRIMSEDKYKDREIIRKI